MKFLRRYLDEKEPTLKNFAKVVAELTTAEGASLVGVFSPALWATLMHGRSSGSPSTAWSAQDQSKSDSTGPCFP